MANKTERNGAILTTVIGSGTELWCVQTTVLSHLLIVTIVITEAVDTSTRSTVA